MSKKWVKYLNKICLENLLDNIYLKIFSCIHQKFNFWFNIETALQYFKIIEIIKIIKIIKMIKLVKIIPMLIYINQKSPNLKFFPLKILIKNYIFASCFYNHWKKKSEFYVQD